MFKLAKNYLARQRYGPCESVIANTKRSSKTRTGSTLRDINRVVPCPRRAAIGIDRVTDIGAAR